MYTLFFDARFDLSRLACCVSAPPAYMLQSKEAFVKKRFTIQ